MIGSLRGELLANSRGELLVEVAGIGYRVQCTPNATNSARVGDEVFIHIHHHQREDAEILYGFESLEQRRVFETLIGTHGVGPALGLGILTVHEPAQLARAVAADDVAALCQVPGVGKKTATRLLVELKHRLDVAEIDLTGVPDSTPAVSNAIDDVREALAGLGYGNDEIARILPRLEQGEDSSDLIRQALRLLAAA
jgi:Holliday junction DNA helicase RuvA